MGVETLHAGDVCQRNCDDDILRGGFAVLVAVVKIAHDDPVGFLPDGANEGAGNWPVIQIRRVLF